MSKFAALAAKLFEVNADFETALTKKEHQVDPRKQHIVLFGTPGEGKSTIIARLLDDREPEAFMRMVKGKESSSSDASPGSSIAAGGIKMGHGYGASTMFPQVYRIESSQFDVRFVDMPGFTDAEELTRIVVGAHNHAFLHKTGVTSASCLYLVVVGAQALNDDRLSKLIDRYFKELFDLFGANFNEFLGSCFFAITKNDATNFSVQDIAQKTKKATMLSNQFGNPSISQFLHRFALNHIVVDYNTDTKTSLLEKIMGMCTRAQGRTHLTTRPLGQQIVNLSLICSEEIKRLRNEHVRVKETFGAEKEALNGTVQKLRTEVQDRHHDVSETVKRLRAIIAEADALLKINVQYPEHLADAERNVRTQQSIASELQSQVQLIEQNAMQQSSIDVITLRSSSGGMLGPNYLECALNTPEKMQAYFVVVTDFDAADKEMRAWAGAPSLIPPKNPETALRALSANTHQFVLFNTAEPHVNGGKDFHIECKNSILSIKIACRTTFSVYIYFVVPFVHTVEYAMLRNDVNLEVKKVQDQVRRYEGVVTNIKATEKNAQGRAEVVLPNVDEDGRRCEHLLIEQESLFAHVESIKQLVELKCGGAAGASAGHSTQQSREHLTKIAKFLERYELTNAFEAEWRALTDEYRLFQDPDIVARAADVVFRETMDLLREMRVQLEEAISIFHRFNSDWGKEGRIPVWDYHGSPKAVAGSPTTSGATPLHADPYQTPKGSKGFAPSYDFDANADPKPGPKGRPKY